VGEPLQRNVGRQYPLRHSIEKGLRALADELERPLPRSQVNLQRYPYTGAHWKLYEFKIEAGALLYRAVRLGAFD
jgi:hypothetical protein